MYDTEEALWCSVGSKTNSTSKLERTELNNLRTRITLNKCNKS